MPTENLKIKTPARIIVQGPSCAGKTHLIEQLVLNHHLCFDKPISEVVWIQSEFTDQSALFQRLKKNLSIPLKTVTGFPDEKIRNNNLFTTSRDSQKLLVLDDQYISPQKNDTLFQIFTILSHHHNINVIVTVQNLSGSTATQKSFISILLRNSSHVCLFVNRCNLPIASYIAKTYYIGEGYRVMQPFRYLMNLNQKYKYLLFNFTTEDPLLQVTECGLLPTEQTYGFQFSQ